MLQTIINNELCSGCGACAGVCSRGAITIDYPRTCMPVIHEAKCDHCRICYDVCPGKGWPVVKWIAGARDQTKNEMPYDFGPVNGFFLGRSTNSEIHLNGASGGTATALLLYLLETNKVDTVAVVTLEQGYPMLRITDDPKVVLASGGSKYSPVPVMEHIIKALKDNPCRMAITALPCHLAALRYAMGKDRRLAERELFAIGLFCGDVKHYESVYRIADALNLKCPEESKFLGWRCGSWPGVARFELNDDSFKDKSLRNWLGMSIPYYALHRCLMCPARENWLADLSLADNHVGATGDTVIVARTGKGYDLLQKAAAEGYMNLTEVNQEQAKKIVTRTKFVPALSYINWRKQKGYPVPEYDYDELMIFPGDKRILAYLRSFKYRLFIWIRRKWLMNFLIRRPVLMEKTGMFLNQFPGSVPGARIAARWIKRFLINNRKSR